MFYEFPIMTDKILIFRKLTTHVLGVSHEGSLSPKWFNFSSCMDK